MKIGILTFHLGPNHGGYLQAHSLYEYIQSMGHDVEIINYKNAKHHENETFKPWIYRNPLKLYHAWIKHRVFQKAYGTLTLSKFTTDVNEVEWEKYDAVVIGSDVVWDFSWLWLGNDHVYVGGFGRPYLGKKIAYAPSAGTVSPDLSIPEWVSRGLTTMDGICARDENTAQMVYRACEKEAPLVVDPTWLDMKYTDKPKQKQKHLVIYAYEVTEGERQAVLAYAKKQGLKIIALGYYLSWADQNDMKLGPLDYPEIMQQAEVVIAGTFHGTLYAIKTQSQFVTLYNERIKYRVGQPLQAAGLEDRVLRNPDDLEDLLKEPINYRKVMTALEPFVQFSRDYLKTQLS